MKPPRPKPHLIISEEPLIEGRDYAPVCSTKKKPVTVTKVAWTFEGEFPQGAFRVNDIAFIEFMRCCSKCKTSAIPKGRYIYGAISGQEAKQEGQ